MAKKIICFNSMHSIRIVNINLERINQNEWFNMTDIRIGIQPFYASNDLHYKLQKPPEVCLTLIGLHSKKRYKFHARTLKPGL